MRADGPLAQPAVTLVAIFVALVVLPVGAYLYLAHPAWSWLYLVDPAGVPGLGVVPTVSALGGAVLAGWYVGCRLLRSEKDRQLVYGLLGGVALSLLLTLIFAGRLGDYGTFEEFHRGEARELFDVKLGYVLVGLLFGTVAAVGYVALELLRDSRRVRTR